MSDREPDPAQVAEARRMVQGCRGEAGGWEVLLDWLGDAGGLPAVARLARAGVFRGADLLEVLQAAARWKRTPLPGVFLNLPHLDGATDWAAAASPFGLEGPDPAPRVEAVLRQVRLEMGLPRAGLAACKADWAESRRAAEMGLDIALAEARHADAICGARLAAALEAVPPPAWVFG